MTVSTDQIKAAQAHGLINVTGLAAACDKYAFPFHLACAILDKETDGRNIFGHDKRKKPDGTYTTEGVAFSGPDDVNIEVTEGRYKEFLRLIDTGSKSNGVGAMQLTYRGYHIGPESLTAKGLKAWEAADNILYGVSLLAHDYKAQLAKGLSVEKAFWNTAKIFNGGSLTGPAGATYADDAVVKARTWAATVGSSDTEVPVSDERIPFRGGLACRCVVESLPLVEEEMLLRGLIKESIDIFQFGYRDDVGSSAGTHARGYNTDTGQFNDAQIDIWRLHGWTMQHRTKAQGFDLEHGHGGPWGCPHGSPAAQDQIAQWRNRQNGLVSHGPVQGRWPVKNYRDAMDERRKVIMALADDIAKKTVAEQIRRGPELGQAIAKGFLTADDIITAGHTEPDPKNTAWAAKTFITNDFNALDDIRDQAKAIRAVLEKLASTPEPPPA